MLPDQAVSGPGRRGSSPARPDRRPRATVRRRGEFFGWQYRYVCGWGAYAFRSYASFPQPICRLTLCRYVSHRRTRVRGGPPHPTCGRKAVRHCTRKPAESVLPAGFISVACCGLRVEITRLRRCPRQSECRSSSRSGAQPVERFALPCRWPRRADSPAPSREPLAYPHRAP